LAGKKLKLFKDSDPALNGEHIREGLGGIISVKVSMPPASIVYHHWGLLARYGSTAILMGLHEAAICMSEKTLYTSAARWL
jgi:hypothetical protein